MNGAELLTARDALVMPLRGTLDRFSAGVFQDGVCLPESLLFRGDAANPYGFPAEAARLCQALQSPEQGGATRLRGEYVFGGYLFRHYGHFLIETLSRLYAIRTCPDVPILFSSTHRDIMPWQRDVFKLLGLRNEIIKLTEPVVVDTLLLAPPGFVLPDTVSEAQITALGRMPAPPLTNKKIWLARSSHLGGGLVNERELEPLLTAAGWEIVHPQYLPVRKQVALIASSAHVAGLDGSAFHTALLAREVLGRFSIFFLRNVEAQAYTRIAAAKGIRQADISLAGKTRFLLGQGAERFYQLEDPGFVLDALEAGASD